MSDSVYEMFLEAEMINEAIDEGIEIRDARIRSAIKVECDRQGVGEDRQAMLWFAYNTLYDLRDQPLTKDTLTLVADNIEPGYQGQYRVTPVYFNEVVGGVHPDNIPRSMESWMEWFNRELEYSRPEESGTEATEAVIREFLDIHPFSDGNGRTAWLLRVWMLNQWEDPQPLPNYYGEGTDIRE